MTELLANAITVRAGSATLVDGVSLRLRGGELAVLLGANGAGKTTLLRSCLGLQPLASGSATLDGVATASLSAARRAEQIAYLPQLRKLAWPNRVRDVVALGRYSHGATLGRLRGADAQAVQRALRDCDLTALAERPVDTLSGGEQARVHCARAFATQAPLLLADEPTAALDPLHQFRIMDLVKGFVARGGGALVVLHDIGLAARYANASAVLEGGPADRRWNARRDTHCGAHSRDLRGGRQRRGQSGGTAGRGTPKGVISAAGGRVHCS